ERASRTHGNLEYAMGDLEPHSRGDSLAAGRLRLSELLKHAARMHDEHRPAVGVVAAAEAVEMARLLGDGPRLAHALSLLGGHCRRAGETGRALAVLLEGAELAEKYGELPIQAACLSDLGYLALMGGELTEASAYLDRALAIRQELSDVVGEAQCLDYLAFTLHEEGEQARAEDLLDRAHRLRQEHGEPKWIAASLDNKAYLASLLAERAGMDPQRVAEYRQRAVDLLTDAVKYAEQAHHAELASFVRANLIAARVALGELEPSPAAFESRLADTRAHGNRSEEALALYNL